MTQLPQHTCVRLLSDLAEVLRPCIVEFANIDTLRSIDESIAQSKQAARGRFPRPDLRDLANMATRLTGKLELLAQGLILNDADRDLRLGRLSSDQLALIRDVADVAARALRASAGDESNANEECQEGLSWAYSVAERLADNELQDEIQSLVDNAMPH